VMMVGRPEYGSVAPPPPPPVFRVSWRNSSVSILVCAFLAALATGGPTYAFGIYGSTLKATLHLSQSELDTISSANFCAGLFSALPGLCVDRWGPKIAMATGGILQSAALVSYWVAARMFAEMEVSHGILIACLSTLGIVLFLANSLVIGSVFKAIVVSCGSGSKGMAVGAAKGYVGLGAGVYSCLFDSLRQRDESDLDFLLMASVFAALSITLPAVVLLPGKEELSTIRDVSTPLHFRSIYSGLLVLALFVAGTSAIFLFEPLPENASENNVEAKESTNYGRASLLLLAWFGPIHLLLFLPRAVCSDTECDSNKSLNHSMRKTADSRPLFLSDIVGTEEDSGIEEECIEYTLTQMLQTLPAWLFLWTCTILVGSGTVMTNNMGQMVESLGLPSRATSASLALFSVAQAAARVVTGSVSESALSWKSDTVCGFDHGVPRPTFAVLAALFGVAAHTLLGTIATRTAFVVGVILSGMAFGSIWPLMVLIVGEIFGTENHGANYMFYDGFTSAIGTLLISKFIAQEIYEAHINSDDLNMDDVTCYGSMCFGPTHLITAGLCLTSLLASVAVLILTRNVYRLDASLHQNDVLYGSPYSPSRKTAK
jgi:MFS family permease